MAFSEFDQRILEVFVTSATDPIYACRFNIPPELFGAFGSYFSRNPEDFRSHLLKAIYGQVEEQETAVDRASLEWLANRDFREPFSAIVKGLQQSRDFFQKWYGTYSHKSIANVVWIPMVATNASQLFARELAYDQLAFFIEQSTRFVKFDAANVFLDPDVMASPAGSRYLEALSAAGEGYNRFTELAHKWYASQLPFEAWQAHQTADTLAKSPKTQQLKHAREIRGKALDISRFLLPQAVRTNIAWILDARSTEYDIAAWKGHPLAEMRGAAALIEGHAGQIAPSLLRYTAENPYYADKLRGYGGDLRGSSPQPFEKGVSVISCEADALDKVLAHMLKRHNRGGTFAQRREEVRWLPFSAKLAMLHRIVQGRASTDEWVEMDEEFDLVKVTLEIRSDLGAVRDWRRHQKWDRSEALYTLDNGAHRPSMLADMPAEAGEIFDRLMERYHAAEQAVRRDFPYQAQYLVPMAAHHAITMTGGLDQAQYMLWTRTTPQGNFSYRIDAFNAAEALVKAHPWLLGYETYPEKTPFLDAYESAPLKNLLRLQLGETGLHQ